MKYARTANVEAFATELTEPIDPIFEAFRRCSTYFPGASFEGDTYERGYTGIRWWIRCTVNGRTAVEYDEIEWKRFLDSDLQARSFADPLMPRVHATMRRVFLAAGGQFDPPRAFRLQRRNPKHLRASQP